MLSEYGKSFDRRPFVIGCDGARFTQVPARDGVGMAISRDPTDFRMILFLKTGHP